MNTYCPVCNLEFEREPGYFLGAMYFSYGLAVVTGSPALILMLLLDVASLWIILAVAVQLIVSSPWLFQYSRIMWLHLDQIFDPR